MMSKDNPFAEAIIFDRSGSRLADITPHVRNVTWRLNDYGDATMFLPYHDLKCTRQILSYGNLILMQFYGGMASFGGVIDDPRSRDGSGVTFTAYSGERIFYRRETATNLDYTLTPPGSIYLDLINSINAEESTVLAPGDIYAGGTGVTREYHNEIVLDVLRNLVADTGEEFAVVPVLQLSGKLRFDCHWYEKRGKDKTGSVLLAEGFNFDEAVLDEQGPIINKLTLFGGGIAYDDNRLMSTAANTTSKNNYGLRQRSFIRSEIKDQSTLDDAVQSRLDVVSNPRVRMTLNGVIDTAPSRFKDYDVGDIVNVQAHSRGGNEWGILNEHWRVIAREWSPSNTCRVELEEYT